MQSYEDIGVMLDDIADEIPIEYYQGLNGGIVLHEERKYHPELPSTNYMILGEYARDWTGSHIRIYYGSFAGMYPDIPDDAMKEKLKEVLMHELQHHLEGRAGAKDLEIEDAVFLRNAKRKLGMLEGT